MTEFPLHTAKTAPDAARPILQQIEKRYGFVPNFYAKLAESPEALKAYLDVAAHFEKTTLSPAEQQVVMLAVSHENACEFCVSAHSFVAKNVAKVPANVVDALRNGKDLPDARLKALDRFARAVVQKRGWVDEAEVQKFLAAGYTRRNVLDVVLGVAQKTLSNYANHFMKTPLNEQLASERWTAPRKSAA